MHQRIPLRVLHCCSTCDARQTPSRPWWAGPRGSTARTRCRSASLGARRANYLVNYGRALAQLRGRRDDAVRALLRAEQISADKLHRNPSPGRRSASSCRGPAMGRELRRMAYQAGLPV